jgi:hypothetical protein
MKRQIAEMILEAKTDAAQGAAVSFAELFPWRDYDEVRLVFDLHSDVSRGMPLMVDIEGVGQLLTAADMDKKAGERPLVGPWMLLPMEALQAPLAVEQGVRRGQKLRVVVTGHDGA